MNSARLELLAQMFVYIGDLRSQFLNILKTFKGIRSYSKSINNRTFNYIFDNSDRDYYWEKSTGKQFETPFVNILWEYL